MEFQTYEDFLNAPFGKLEPKSNDFEKKYKALLSAKRIYIEGNTKVDDNYFLHLKIGSDSNQAQFYDVVIMFFTDNEAVKKGTSLEKYFIKFFCRVFKKLAGDGRTELYLRKRFSLSADQSVWVHKR